MQSPAQLGIFHTDQGVWSEGCHVAQDFFEDTYSSMKLTNSGYFMHGLTKGMIIEQLAQSTMLLYRFFFEPIYFLPREKIGENFIRSKVTFREN